jgi:hypothetical protein
MEASGTPSAWMLTWKAIQGQHPENSAGGWTGILIFSS